VAFQWETTLLKALPESDGIRVQFRPYALDYREVPLARVALEHLLIRPVIERADASRSGNHRLCLGVPGLPQTSAGRAGRSLDEQSQRGFDGDSALE
jgi:hypothetical protein